MSSERTSSNKISSSIQTHKVSPSVTIGNMVQKYSGKVSRAPSVKNEIDEWTLNEFWENSDRQVARGSVQVGTWLNCNERIKREACRVINLRSERCVYGSASAWAEMCTWRSSKLVWGPRWRRCRCLSKSKGNEGEHVCPFENRESSFENRTPLPARWEAGSICSANPTQPRSLGSRNSQICPANAATGIPRLYANGRSGEDTWRHNGGWCFKIQFFPVRGSVRRNWLEFEKWERLRKKTKKNKCE